MELRSRAIPAPWPLPPAHSSLELEASLLDSVMQELLEPEAVGAIRTDERCAASVGCSDRVSMRRGIVPAQLLGCSAQSGWARRRAVRSCTSFRVLAK